MNNTKIIEPKSSTVSLARPAAYQTLAWGMGYPTKERLANFPIWCSDLEATFATLGLPATTVITALNALPADPQKLQVEYTHLFINAVPSVPAPPYASAYVNSGNLMGQPAGAALQAYLEAGLIFSTDTSELPDHLAAELEFMFYLCREELGAIETGNNYAAALNRERQHDFLTYHMLPWLPTWQARVGEHDRLGFYSALAYLIKTWLQTDAVNLHATDAIPMEDR